jgi:hypothetical protein
MANTMTLIASSTVGSGGVSSITFSSIAGTYTDLQLLMQLRSDRSAIGDWIYISFNGSTSSFSANVLDGDGSSAAAYNTFPRVCGYATAASATSNTFGNSSCYIPNYAGSSNKSWSADGVAENNATTAPMTLTAGLWSNTSAITSITLTPRVGTNFVQYSTAYLYGVNNA